MRSHIDTEWQKFLDVQNSNDNNTLLDVETYGNSEFGNNTSENTCSDVDLTDNVDTLEIVLQRRPCEDLYISTQTQIFFLNISDIEIDPMFWEIPIIDYNIPRDGVIKKQMRVIANTILEFEDYNSKLTNYEYYTEKIIKQIDNPKARKVKYKDVRKLTVGISKKDILNCHGKSKNAFINCFAMILRVKCEDVFHEIHVKVFNTGKLAIPGIVSETLLECTKTCLLNILSPCFPNQELKLVYAADSPLMKRLVRAKKTKKKIGDTTTTSINENPKSYFEYVRPKGNVLINSNFNCGYHIQQEKVKALLRNKYGLNPSYDPSMYPGVKCKFYYKNDLPIDAPQSGILATDDTCATMTELDELSREKYTRVSFMIFRTGNCLIVGNCTKEILNYVFMYVKKILMDEYDDIKATNDTPVVKIKKKKIRKVVIQVDRKYYNSSVIRV
jgi:hypothetical protein